MSDPGEEGEGRLFGARTALEHTVRDHAKVRELGAEVLGSTVGERGIVVHLSSTEGGHDVTVPRPEWAEIEPTQLADFIAQKVANEIRWRRTSRRPVGERARPTPQRRPEEATMPPERSTLDRQLLVSLGAFLAAALAACTPRPTPPTTSVPVPGYVSVDASTADAWDAVVDFLVDNGIAFDFISADMRIAKVQVLLSTGPRTVRMNVVEPDAAAQAFADCGFVAGEPVAGYGSLIADVAVRVRPGAAGALVKVVIPRLRQTDTIVLDGVTVQCVSKGTFERAAEAGIAERLAPIMKPGRRP
jgi:hypothetical protein